MPTSFSFSLLGETCLTPDQTSLLNLIDLLDPTNLLRQVLTCWFYRQLFRPLVGNFTSTTNQLTSSTTSRLLHFDHQLASLFDHQSVSLDNLSVLLDQFTWTHLLWFGFSWNLQMIFLSLKDLRNYNVFHLLVR